jgi:UDP-glucose:(heptosyl)LPS alpha-1,3-glucosyltransferase
MKVALVLERFDVQRGGAERSTSEMAHCLSALGLDVTIVAGKITDGDHAPFAMAEVPFTGISQASQWRNWEKALEDYFSRNRYDVIHSMVPLDCADVYQPRGGSFLHSQRRHYASYGNGLAAKLKPLATCFNRGRQIRIERERHWCRAANGSILAALSDYVGQQFISLYGLEPARVRLIRNGVSVDAFRCDAARVAGQKLRALYDRDGKTSLFLFAAENLRLKGLRWVIQAAKRMAEKMESQDRDFRLMVVSGSDWGGYWKESNRLGLNEQVLFMGSTTKMPALMQMADAVVLPTYNDACSRVVLEALAAGTPAITTRHNGAAESLGDNKYGHVLDRCDDTEELAQVMLKFCDREYRNEMCGQIERDRLFEQVSMMRHAQELVELYRDSRC